MGIESGLASASRYLSGLYPDKEIDNIYGYSVYNLDSDKVIARVYKAFALSEWVKVEADTDEILEYYREFYSDTPNSIVCIAYDVNSLAPLEYYKATNIRGFNERIKFDYVTGREMTRDMFGTIDQISMYMPSDILAKIIKLQYPVEYYSNKPYGRVIGISEQEK